LEARIFLHEDEEVIYYMEFDKISNLYYPHFIAEYGESTLRVAIDLSIIEGELPGGRIFEVINWAQKNNNLLQSMWEKLIKKKINNLNMKKAV
jgi:hypothetical protein